MDVVTWFLNIHFTWADMPDGHLGIHLSQVAYAQTLVEQYCQHTINYNSRATPYCSGLPIDSILPTHELDDDPVFLCRKLQYQSLVGSLNWLVTTTRPDISPVTSFLAAHANRPSQTHMDSGISIVKYLCSTADYGIAFHFHATSIFPFTMILRHSKMPYPQLQQNITASPHTPTHAGAAKLVPSFHPAQKMKCIRYDRCQGKLYSVAAVPLRGSHSGRAHKLVIMLGRGACHRQTCQASPFHLLLRTGH